MASGFSMWFRRAPLHVLGILLSSALFLLGFSLPPFPPGSVIFLSFGVGVRVARVC